MNETEIAEDVRDAVANLNRALERAARAGLAVQLRTAPHHTTNGVEQIVVEVLILKQL